ncbi:hypothetical protein [Formosa sp. A9]|uniref:hypothetical protein n=1 Tax=Formosa sp. A9 TaxID=3442641 RepID=UPI003EBE1919
MKRFIDLGYEVTKDGWRAFSFFCTEKKVIETFNGNHYWTKVTDFGRDYDNDDEDIQDYLGLIPNDFNEGDNLLIVDLSPEEIKLDKLRPKSYLEPAAIVDLQTDLYNAVKDENYKLAHYISAKLDFLTANITKPS